MKLRFYYGTRPKLSIEDTDNFSRSDYKCRILLQAKRGAPVAISEHKDTGTRVDRENFQRLLADCRAGKIDMVVTKSISRLARNTVTLLETVRELKDLGVAVYFEEQNIHSASADGELRLSILASYAQEESRSISENVTWGRRKQFADGKVSLPYWAFLGYRKGKDGLPEIVQEEAEIVKRIYAMFMQGKTSCAIAKILTADGIPTPSGKHKWSVTTVDSILRNEKYRGDARLQKTFTMDFLQKKMKTNEGEVPQYYVQNSHPAIIDPYEWDLVQAEIARRKELGQRYSANSVFSATIVCGDCGAFYGAKVWHSTDQYRRTVWQCNDKFKGEHRCKTPHLTEQQIQTLFLRSFSKVHSMRDSILEDCLLVQRELFDCTELDARQATLAEEMELDAELVRRCVEENSLKVQDQMEYLQRYERHVQRYEKLKKKYDTLDAEKQRRKEQHGRLGAFIDTLRTQTDLPVQFEPNLWLAVIEKATVHADHRVVFTFKGGMEITEEM